MGEDNGKKSKPRLGLRVAAHAAGGAALGYLLLHPCSMFIHHLQAGGHSWWHFFPMSFSPSHVPMAAYFTILGTFLGFGHGLYLQRLAALYRKMELLSITDPLTSLYNRRYFTERLEVEMARAKRYAYSLSLAMIDIDHFKQYNDTHGHQRGDELLKNFADVVRGVVRGTDFAARYGGEEFVVVLQGNIADACRLAERLRFEVEAYPFSGGGTQPEGKATVSIGVAELPRNALDAEGLIRAADLSLYVAKSEGRNRVRRHACQDDNASPEKPVASGASRWGGNYDCGFR